MPSYLIFSLAAILILMAVVDRVTNINEGSLAMSSLKVPSYFVLQG